jgi:hypothetical protein
MQKTYFDVWRKSPMLTYPEAVALAATLRWGVYAAHVEWDMSSTLAPHYRIVFTGGEKGTHSLAISCSSEARVMAHWDGYTNSTPDDRKSITDQANYPATLEEDHMTHDELAAKIKRQADVATCCLMMVSCHVRFKNTTLRVHCYLMPWECLDRARAFMEIPGVQSIGLYGTGNVYFDWTRPPVRSHRRKSTIVPARLDADRTAKPMTELVGHSEPGKLAGDGITQADTYRPTRS